MVHTVNGKLAHRISVNLRVFFIELRGSYLEKIGFEFNFGLAFCSPLRLTASDPNLNIIMLDT